MSDKHKKLYELAYFLSSSIAEDDVASYTHKLRELLEKHDSEIVKEDAPHIRNLAYPIKHELQGYFGYMHFKNSPKNINEINTALRLTVDYVLRSLITEVSKKQLEQMAGGNIYIPSKQQKEAEAAVESVLKEGAKSKVEEQKASFGELDEKLDEILNK
ncbi:30S ribosomal protein S6 [Candidatus Azambacteria bacterium]|nr:30S ribosomal protein S6 [Candidatus Azambacteria bacterium]